jgi:hypothetical protein
MITEKKIVQIIPCERGWHCTHYFRDKDGKIELDGGNCKTAWTEVACWALLTTGEVEPMVGGDKGPVLASDWSDDGGEYHVYSPPQSWEYALTAHTRAGSIEEPYPDWEAIHVSEGPELTTVLWRGHR